MNLFMILGVVGPWQIILIIVVVLLLFGGKKIPELMRGIGRGISEFNNARRSLETEFKEGVRDAERKKLDKKEEEEEEDKKNMGIDRK